MNHEKSYTGGIFCKSAEWALLEQPLVQSCYVCFKPAKWKPAKLSVQLYTVRDQIKTDFPGTQKKLRAYWI